MFLPIKEFHINHKKVLTQYFFIFTETYTTNFACHMEMIELYITNQFFFSFFAYESFPLVLPLIACN